MDVLTAIQTRASAGKLSDPAPQREHLQQILEAGVRAPDHGRLRPWRYVVLEGAARDRLGEILVRLLLAKVPSATATQIEGERAKAYRAPTIIVAGVKVTTGKIPAIEQVAAVAAGVQNMFLAAHALGYGAMWKTGGAAYDTDAKQAFGLEAQDHIVGFFYVGTLLVPCAPSTPVLDGFVSYL